MACDAVATAFMAAGVTLAIVKKVRTLVWTAVGLLPLIGLVLAGRVVRERDFTGRTLGYGYDAAGNVIEFNEELMEYLALQVERETGFVTDWHEITLYGRCADCAVS